MHGELEGALEVGLLEHGEDAAGVGHLELAVEVDLAVLGVHEAVQALAGVHVGAVGDDGEGVARLQVGERDAAVREVRGGVQRLAVEGDASGPAGAIRSMNVDSPGVAAKVTVEVERKVSSEVVRSSSTV